MLTNHPHQLGTAEKCAFLTAMAAGLPDHTRKWFLRTLDKVEIQGAPEKIAALKADLDSFGYDIASYTDLQKQKLLDHFKGYEWLIDDKRDVLTSGVNWKRNGLVVVTRWPRYEEEIIGFFGVPAHLYLDFYLSDDRPIDVTDCLYALTSVIDWKPEHEDGLSKLTWSFHSGDQSMITKVKKILDPFLAKYRKD